MNQQQALTQLRKVLGSSLGYRVNVGALGAEERAKAQAEADQHRQTEKALDALLQQRLAELLTDPQYVALKADRAAARKAAALARARATTRRIVVGRTINVGGFRMFEVKAEADNWADAVAAVAAKVAQ